MPSGSCWRPCGRIPTLRLWSLEYLGAATLIWCVARTAGLIAGLTAAVLAGLLMASREQLCSPRAVASSTSFVAALVAGAALAFVRGRGARVTGAAVLLALAGLLRPEPWLVLALLGFWRWRSRGHVDRASRSSRSSSRRCGRCPTSSSAVTRCSRSTRRRRVVAEVRAGTTSRHGARAPPGRSAHLAHAPVLSSRCSLGWSARCCSGRGLARRHCAPGSWGTAMRRSPRSVTFGARHRCGDHRSGDRAPGRDRHAALRPVRAPDGGAGRRLRRRDDNARRAAARAGSAAARHCGAGLLLLLVAAPFLIHARRTTDPEHARYVDARSLIERGRPCGPIVVPGRELPGVRGGVVR